MKRLGQILTLAAMLALAAAFPTVVCAQVTCGQVVTSDLTLLPPQLGPPLVECENSDGLKVGADGITIDLGVWEIRCVGANSVPHCQGSGLIGIDTQGHSNVTIKNGIVGRFDVGIHVNGGGNVTVWDVLVTGPAWSEGGGYSSRASSATGILVGNVSCRDGALIDGNTVDNHLIGIKLVSSRCVKVQHNIVTQNDGPTEAHGILVMDSSRNTLTANTVSNNGANYAGSSGITLAGTSSENRLTRNILRNNCGDGISARDTASLNNISNNSARGNPPGGLGDCSVSGGPFYDLADRTNSSNNWSKTNACETENERIPANVCNLGE